MTQQGVIKASSGNQSQANGRRRLAPDLPRQIVQHDIPECERCCPRCEGKIHQIGKEVSEQLDCIPAYLYVKEHRRYKYACRRCQHVVIAKMPEQPIDKGLAGAGLLSELLISKYQEHLPLYRLESRFKRFGYDLARSTLCDWVDACADRLAPIVDAMKKDMLAQCSRIHADETVLPVLSPEKTHQGRLWVYVGGGDNTQTSIVYQYSKTRRAEVPMKFLKGFKGYLQTDGYAGYNECCKDSKVTRVGCWAHARRKFVDAASLCETKLEADTAIDYIALLYEIESRIKNKSTLEKYYYRKKYSKPHLKIFKRWLEKISIKAPPKSPMGQAIAYTLKQWDVLVNYLRNGVCNIDNNTAERAINPAVIGRKNYLFAGSHKGAKNAAVIYSLIETCKTLKIEPFWYLKDVLERLPTTLMSQIRELIPGYWRSAKDQVLTLDGRV